MAKAISWLAVNKRGEVCLDSDPSPLPRGWERCLDLQSGVMYLKQMNTSSHNDIKAINKGTFHKRKRLLFDDDNGAGDPALQLSLSLPTCSFNSGDSHQPKHPRAQCLSSAFAPAEAAMVPTSSSRGGSKKPMHVWDNDSVTSKPSCATESRSLVINELLSLSQATQSKEIGRRRDATTSSNGSSPSYNASSSSSSSSAWTRNDRKGLRGNQGGLGGVNQERNVIKARGCPHCFMYVLPSRHNPKCPRCKSHILVDLFPLTTH